jgi:hypothetical protein
MRAFLVMGLAITFMFVVSFGVGFIFKNLIGASEPIPTIAVMIVAFGISCAAVKSGLLI